MFNQSNSNNFSCESLSIETDNRIASSPLLYYSILTTLIIIEIAILIGNSLVVLAVATTKSLRTVTNYFIVSLAIADLLVAIIVLPLSIYMIAQKHTWIFGSVLCDIWVSSDVMLCTASILNLCCISLDRYLAITRPLKYSRKRSPRLALNMIAVVWVASIIISIPPILGWKDPKRHLKSNYCYLNNLLSYRIYSSLGSFYLPAVVIIFVYVRVFQIISVREKRLSTALKKYGKLTYNHSSQKKPKKDQIRLSPLKLKSDDDNATGSPANADKLSLCNDMQDNRDTLKCEPSQFCVQRSLSNFNSLDTRFLKKKLLPQLHKLKESQDTHSHRNRLYSHVSEYSFSDSMRKMKTKTNANNANINTTTNNNNRNNQNGNKNKNSSNHNNKKAKNDKLLNVSDTSYQNRSNNFYYSSDPMLYKQNENITIIMGKETSKNYLTSGLIEEKELLQSNERLNESQIIYRNNAKNVTRNRGSKRKASNLINDVSLSPKTKTCFPSSICCCCYCCCCCENISIIESDENKTNLQTTTGRQTEQIRLLKESKAAKTLAIVVGGFILCWLPFFIMYVLESACTRCCIPVQVVDFITWLGYFNSVVNPVIYAFYSKQFRYAFFRLTVGKLHHKQQNPQNFLKLNNNINNNKNNYNNRNNHINNNLRNLRR